MSRQEKWDRRFIELARYIAGWSKDPSTKCGAVIVDRAGAIVSVGYNGFPRGVHDTLDRLNDRETKYKIVVHAERNALLFAQKPMACCTLYTWPFMSCAACAGMVIQAGIARCVAPFSDNPRWVADFELSQQMFLEAQVQLELVAKEPTEADRLLENLTATQARCTELLESPRPLPAAASSGSSEGLFGAEWHEYRRRCVPHAARHVQVQETRRAFYGGGAALFLTLLALLEPGREATENDLAMLDRLKAEFDGALAKENDK